MFCFVGRSFRPDFLLVRQNLRDASEDHRALLLGFKFGGVPSVNSPNAIYNFQVILSISSSFMPPNTLLFLLITNKNTVALKRLNSLANLSDRVMLTLGFKSKFLHPNPKPESGTQARATRFLCVCAEGDFAWNWHGNRPTLTREYFNLPPPIFLKLSGLQDSFMERFPSSKLAAQMHFSTFKIALKIEEKM